MKRFVMVSIVVLLFCVTMVGFSCGHNEVYAVTVKEPSCTDAGQTDIICEVCEAVVESVTLDAYGHAFGQYAITKAPTAGKNGLEAGRCDTCGMEDVREYVCPHNDKVRLTMQEATCAEKGRAIDSCNICGAVVENYILEALPHEATHTEIVKEPTCSDTGIQLIVCDACGSSIDEEVIPCLECNFSEWTNIKVATPEEAGDRYKECVDCGRKERESYQFEMEDNTIWIPGTKINSRFHIGKFTQGNVDRNDILYTENAYKVKDPSNPFILGHNYGTMGELPNVKVGQHVYISVNGQVETYEVVVSEYAVEPDGIHMVGKTTGVSIWDTYGSTLNHEYASFGRKHDGVDRLEDNSGKTLHMYTCHGNSNAGGRWIVLATLV